MTRTSTVDELRKYYFRLKPSKSDLEKAEYSPREYRPLSIDSHGYPAMRKLKLIYFLSIAFAAYWVYYQMQVRRGVVSPNMIVDLLALVVAVGVGGSSIGVFWKLNEGTFSDYILILEPFLVWWHGQLKRSILRIERADQIFPLSDDVLITAESLKGKLSEPGPPDSDPADLKSADSSALITKDSDLRPSSLTDIQVMFKEILGEEPKKYRPEVDLSLALEQDFVDLVRTTRMGWIATKFKTPDFYGFFVSKNSLIGTGANHTDPNETPNLEFQYHPFYQKTYVWDKENKEGSWCVAVWLEDLRYWAWNEGKKEYEMFFAPIFYVAFSDAELTALIKEMRPSSSVDSEGRLVPDLNTAQLVRQAYTATLAEVLIDRVKLLTGIIDKKDKEIEQLQRRSDKASKRLVAEALRWLMLANTSLDESLTDKLKAIFSKGAVKWIVILIFGVLAFVGFLLILQLLTGIEFLPLPAGGGGSVTPTNPVPYEP